MLVEVTSQSGLIEKCMNQSSVPGKQTSHWVVSHYHMTWLLSFSIVVLPSQAECKLLVVFLLLSSLCMSCPITTHSSIIICLPGVEEMALWGRALDI